MAVRLNTETAIAAWLGDPRPCLILAIHNPSVMAATFASILSSFGWSSLSVGRELAAALLPVPPRRRAHETERWLVNRLAPLAPGPVLWTEIDLLFEPGLELDPLRLAIRHARAARIAVAWPGTFTDGVLAYAEPDHAHHRRWPHPDVAVAVLP